MEYLSGIAALLLTAILIIAFVLKQRVPEFNKAVSPYKYVRKPYIMTEAEAHFYKRLQNIVEDRYYVFPQVHLSSLAKNITAGKYHKAGFQRINRRSVDYVLADIETLQAVYAVELDDRTHDTEKGKAVDALKNEILGQIGLPIVRFRNTQTLSDEDIIQSFKLARAKVDRI